MKKFILVFVAVAITAGAYAQSDSTNRKVSLRDMNNHQMQNVQNTGDELHPDGVLMKNGKVMVVKNGQKTTLGHDMTMSNGTKIMSDGNYTKKDGRTMMLKEGEHMDMEGNMSPMNTTGTMHRMDTKSEKNMDFNRGVNNNSDDAFKSDGVVMQNGKMMMVKNGKMTTLDHEMTMTNGTKITTDGNYTKKDGTTMKWKEGEHMDMSGNMNSMNPKKDRNMYLVPDSTRKNK